MSKRGFGKLNPRASGNDSLRLEEIVRKHDLGSDAWNTLRFVGEDILPIATHWVKILSPKQKKETKVPRICVSFDPNNESVPLDGIECPYCTLDKEAGGSAQVHYYINAIVREDQEEEPARKHELSRKEKKTGFKDINTKSWTPVSVVRLPATPISRLIEIGELNVVRNKKTNKSQAFEVTHPRYGCDISIKYKPKASGADKYSVDRSVEQKYTPLTKEERSYLLWDLDDGLADLIGRMTPEQAQADYKKLTFIDGENIDNADGSDEGEDDYGSDEGLDLGKKKKRRSKKTARKDESDYGDDTPPRRKKRTKRSEGSEERSPRKKRPTKRTEESSTRRKKKTSATSPRRKKRDDIDTPPRRKKRASKTTSATPRKKKRTKELDPYKDDVPF